MSLGTGPANGGRRDEDTIPPQPTVMVTGSGGRQLRSVGMELFDERSTRADGAVVVTTRDPPTATAGRLSGGSGGVAPDRLAVIDARDVVGEDLDAGFVDDDGTVGYLERVDPRADPESMSGSVVAGLEWLASAGVERRHFLYDTLGTVHRLREAEAVYDRAYRIAMTVGAEEGLALFALDDDGLTEDVVERLGHLFDVTVEVRTLPEVTELRWTGLVGASDGWVCLADADLGVGGFR